MRASLFSPAKGALRTLLTLTALTSTLLALQAWIAAPKAWQPTGLIATAVLAPLGALLLVIVTPAAIRLATRPKRALREALMVATFGGSVLAVAAGRQDLTLWTFAALLLVLAGQPLWPELTDTRAQRQGWWLLGAAGLVFLALSLLEWPSVLFIAVGTVLMLFAIVATVWGFWLLTKNAPLPPRSSDGPLQATYTMAAQAGVAPFGLMRDKAHFFSRDRQAYLAYACRADVALVLGPGIGPAASVLQLYREFRAACHQRGWRVAYYQVSDAVASTLGGPRKRLGSEAIVDLGSLSLDGPAMAKLRHEVSRGKRNGVMISVIPQNQLSGETRQALAALATTWGAGHGLGDMAFSVGHHDDRPQVPTVYGLARDVSGRLVGYCTWLRLPAARAVVLDEVRRLPQAPAGTMDLLLYTCLDQLRPQAAWASLGLAPMAGAEQADRLARLEAGLLQRLGVSSASASLFSFKGKYRPLWEPRYLVVERLVDWPAVALATFLVHYPAWDRRMVRHVPFRLRMVRGHAAAAVSFALLLTGLSGMVAAAAWSREGHPLYAVRTAVHAETGLLAFTGAPPSRPSRIHFLRADSLKPPVHPHRVHRLLAHPVITHYHGNRHGKPQAPRMTSAGNVTSIRQFRKARAPRPGRGRSAR